ncbi:hypothetical protein, partial [Thioclava kandeliae]
ARPASQHEARYELHHQLGHDPGVMVRPATLGATLDLFQGAPLAMSALAMVRSGRSNASISRQIAAMQETGLCGRQVGMISS